MTRKDDIVLAGALRNAIIAVEDESHRHSSSSPEAFALLKEGHGIRSAAVSIADALEQDNPRFNRLHFLAVVRNEKALTSRPGRS